MPSRQITRAKEHAEGVHALPVPSVPGQDLPNTKSQAYGRQVGIWQRLRTVYAGTHPNGEKVGRVSHLRNKEYLYVVERASAVPPMKHLRASVGALRGAHGQCPQDAGPDSSAIVPPQRRSSADRASGDSAGR